jgi:DNA-binding transcriptional LysR family regulator
MVQPAQLRALTAVLETGSFAKASRRLGLSPAAVSQQIAALERALDLELFERSARAASPSPAASALGLSARRVLHQLEAFEQEAQAIRKAARGVVRIGSFPTASARLLPPALARLQAAGPGVEVLLDEAEPADLLLGVEVGSLDLALVYHYDLLPRRSPSSVSERLLLRESLILLTHPRQHRPRSRSEGLAGLADADWIASREGTEGARCLLRLGQMFGFTPRITQRSNDYAVVRGLVAAGLGVAVIPALAHVDGPDISATRLDLHGQGLSVSIIHRPGDANPLVERCVGVLSAAAAALSSPLITPTEKASART